MFRNFSFVSSHVSVFSAWPLELVPRVSRWLHPACPSDALSPQEVEDWPVVLVPRWRRPGPNILVTSKHPQSEDQYEHMEEECVFKQRNLVTQLARAGCSNTQETLNRQLTLPRPSHRRCCLPHSYESSIHQSPWSHVIIKRIVNSSRYTLGKFSAASQTIQ